MQNYGRDHVVNVAALVRHGQSFKCILKISYTFEAVEKIPPEKRSPKIEGKFFRNPRFSPNPRIFGRTGLSISLSTQNSTSKLILTSVRLWLAQNHTKLAKNKISDPKFSQICFGGRRNVRNRLKRVLAKFRDDPSHVRAVTKKFSAQSAAGN